MNISTYPVDAFVIDDITGSHKLDPVRVLLEDIAPGKGRIVVECYGRAWSAYWGAMGTENTVANFVRKADADYLADNLIRHDPNHETPHEEIYVGKIARAVVDALWARHHG